MSYSLAMFFLWEPWFKQVGKGKLKEKNEKEKHINKKNQRKA